MSNLRQRLIDRGAVKHERVTVTGPDGEAIAVDVYELKAGERGRILTDCLVSKLGADDEDEAEQVVDQAKLGPMLVIACAHDPETGEHIFGPTDTEIVAEMSATFIDPIVKCAVRMSKLSPSAQKETEKNSVGTPEGSDSGTGLLGS